MPGLQRMRIYSTNSHLPLVMATDTNLTQATATENTRDSNPSLVMCWFGCNTLHFPHQHGFVPLPSLSQACWNSLHSLLMLINYPIQHKLKEILKGSKRRRWEWEISSLHLHIQKMFLSATKKQNLASACLCIVGANALGPWALNPFRSCGFSGGINKTSHHGSVMSRSWCFDH